MGSGSDAFHSHWGEGLMKDGGGTAEESCQVVVVDWGSFFPRHGMRTCASN